MLKKSGCWRVRRRPDRHSAERLLDDDRPSSQRRRNRPPDGDGCDDRRM